MAAVEPSALRKIAGSPLSAVGYRNQAPSFEPLSGEGARRFGGRFNPPGSFPVLYLCLTRRCVAAELRRQAARQNVDVSDLLPRALWESEVELDRVLDLTDPAFASALGISRGQLVGDDRRFTQQIGWLAHALEFQAIKAPSATGVDDVLAVFRDHVEATAIGAHLVETWTVPSQLDPLS